MSQDNSIARRPTSRQKMLIISRSNRLIPVGRHFTLKPYAQREIELTQFQHDSEFARDLQELQEAGLIDIIRHGDAKDSSEISDMFDEESIPTGNIFPQEPRPGHLHYRLDLREVFVYKHVPGIWEPLSTGITVGSSQTIIVNQTTTGLTAGDFCYLSGNNTWQPADATALATTPRGVYEGLSGAITLNGVIESANFIGGLSIAAQQTAYMSKTPGKLTNDISEAAGYSDGNVSAPVGYIVDATDYALFNQCTVACNFEIPARL